MGWFKRKTEKARAEQTSITRMKTESDFQTALEASKNEPVVIYKHSATCGISLWARREIEDLQQPSDPAIFEVVVQEARPLSNHIAHHFQIRHESPQAIVIKDGHPIFNTSHGGVRADSLREAAIGT